MAFLRLHNLMQRVASWGMSVAGLLLLSLMSAGVVQAQGRHALIIGIGEYSAASKTEPLKGMPTDMANARRMAIAMGTRASDIVELRDTQATKPRILAALSRLQSSVKPGDRVFIYWSGHGSRFPGSKGCVEGLQTYTAGPYTEVDVVTEAELAAAFEPISRVADKMITIVDACFSGGVIRTGSTARSLSADDVPRPRFNTAGSEQCGVGINQPRTRSLMSELTRLGVMQENVVQIATANYNEVSWDTPATGGYGTNALAQCLLGEAKDLNGSGAISLEELRVCAQQRMDGFIAPHRSLGMLPSTLQVRGNRNLIVTPVATPAAPAQPAVTVAQVAPVPVAPPPAVAAPAVVTAPPAAPPPPVSVAPPVAPPPPVSAAPPVAPPPPVSVSPPAAPPPPASVAPPVVPPRPVAVAAPAVTSAPASQPPGPVTTIRPPQPPGGAVALPGPVGSRATLEDIFHQRDPRIRVEVQAPRQLKIGQDPMSFTVKSSVDGHLYVVLLGSDEKSFYLLYPNTLAKDNRVRANQPLTLPGGTGWQITAAGPPGVDRLLFVVSSAPRDAAIFVPESPAKGEVFTYSVADGVSRQRLLDFFMGRGLKSGSGALGANLIEIKEVQ